MSIDNPNSYEKLGFDSFLRKDDSNYDFDFGTEISRSDVGGVIGDLVITDDQVTELRVSKLRSGTIESQSIVLGVLGGQGDVEIRSGIATGDFANTGAASGFILGLDDSDSDKAKFYFGSSTAYISYDGTTLTIVGTLTATTGTIGGFSIGADYLKDAADSFGLASTVTAGDDVRFWAGDTFANRATADFRVTEAGVVTASNVTITGGSVGSSVVVDIGALNIAARGWTQTSIFSVTDADTVAWGAGTFTSANGTAYSIDAGNTGNMAAATYIYLDIGVSTTVYQTTTTAATAVGAGKVLIAKAQNGTGEATFQVFGGIGGQNIDASSIVADSITSNEISTGYVYAGAIAVSQLTAGTISSKSIVLAVTEGTGDVEMRAGIAAGDFANTGAANGFIFGMDDSDGDKVKFYVGTPTSFIKYNPDDGVVVNIPINVDIALTAGEALTVGNAVGLYGEIIETTTASVATAATYVKQDDPTANFDGAVLRFKYFDSSSASWFILTSFGSMPAIPSGTGLTILTIKVKIYFFQTSSGSAPTQPDVYPNSASFTEGTVTWNTKPATTATIGGLPEYTNEAVYKDTGWVTVTSTQYNNIRTNGITLADTDAGDESAGVSDYNDEDHASPPKIDVEFTYKIQNGKAFKVKATTVEYANSFLGIAQSTVAAAASVQVRTAGKDSNQSGLSATFGTTYYLSDTAGAISTSAGTKTFVVGRNLSTTELQVIYTLNQAV